MYKFKYRFQIHLHYSKSSICTSIYVALLTRLMYQCIKYPFHTDRDMHDLQKIHFLLYEFQAVPTFPEFVFQIFITAFITCCLCFSLHTQFTVNYKRRVTGGTILFLEAI